MVTVPYIDNETLRPAGRVQEAPQATAAAYGAGVGQSLQQLGQGVMDVADAVDFRDQIKAKADSDAAYNQYMDSRRAILRDPETGYLNQTGGNAIGGREAMLERLRTQRSEIEKGLNPRARRAFADRADGLDQQAKETAIVHESGELRRYSTAASEAAITASLEEAGLYYDDTKSSDKFLGEALKETREQAALEGWPPEQLNNRLAEVTSQVTVNRAIRMAAEKPNEVEAFIEEHSDRMLPNAKHDLQTKLKPIIVEAKARAIVDPMLATMDGGDDRYGRPKWLVKSESGGNQQARNQTGSSAMGAVQFLEGTYLEWVQRVNPEWAQGLSRSEILATRGDAQKESEIYRAFRAHNASRLTNAGYEVSPRNEYIMHHMGEGGGLAVLDALKYGDPGQSFYNVLVASQGKSTADTIVAQNPWMRGKSLRGAVNWFENKAGGNRAVQSPSQAYEAAMAIEDPDVREAAISMIDQRMAVSERAQAYEREQSMDDAYERIVTEGIMPEQLPVEQQLLLGPSGMATMRAAAQAQATGTDIHNEDVYLGLYDMANGDAAARKAFMETNLNEEAGSLSQSALMGLKQMQNEMRSLAEERKGAKPGDYIYDGEDFPKVYNQVKDQYQAATGYRPGEGSNTAAESERWVNFTSQLKQAMVQYANENNAPMPQSLIDQTVGMLLTPVIINPKGMLNEREASMFDVPFREQGASVDVNMTATDIPLGERERVTQTLATAYGRAPTEEEVVDHYERELLLRNGLLPEMGYDEIPKDLRKALEREYKGASEEQIIDLFLEMTTRRIQSLGE